MKYFSCLLLLLVALNTFCQSTRTISVTEGLTSSFVFDIMQSSDGFIYIGTRTGLNIYDGYNMQHYRHDAFDPFTISSSSINQIEEDGRGYIWIAFENGELDVFDPRTQRFYHLGDFGNQISQHHKVIKTFILDPDDNIWLSVRPNKLIKLAIPQDFRLDKQEAHISHDALIDFEFYFEDNPMRSKDHAHQALGEEFYLDSSLRLWLCTNDKQLFQVDWQNNFLTSIKKGSPLSKWDKAIFIEDKDHNILCSFGKSWFKIKKNTIEDVEVNPIFNNKGIFSYRRDGSILFGYQDPTFRYNYKVVRIADDNYYSNALKIDTLLNEDDVKGLGIIDNTGVFWIRKESGIMVFNPEKKHFQHYEKNSSIYNIKVHQNRYLTFSSSGGLLKCFDLKDRAPIAISEVFPKLDFAINNIVKDGKGNLIGNKHPFSQDGKRTLIYHKKPIFSYNTNTNELKEYIKPARGLRGVIVDHKKRLWGLYGKNDFGIVDLENEEVNSFLKETELHDLPVFRWENTYLDSLNNIWIATTMGIIKTNSSEFPTNKAKAQLLQNDPKNKNSLSHNFVKCFHDDPSEPLKYFWVGTSGGGLNRYDRKTGQFIHYNTRNSDIPDDVVYQIRSDNNNKLWLSTNNGLSVFDTKTKEFRNFQESDGLQSLEFNTGSSTRLADGSLVFGGINGINIFNPTDEKFSFFHYEPSVKFTELRINNKKTNPYPVIDSSGFVLDAAISHRDQLSLRYFENTISLEFSAMDFRDTKKNAYKYRLLKKSNFSTSDTTWVELGHENKVQFTSLNPGDYLFEVIGSDVYGTWSKKPAFLAICISPPWWSSTLAYCIYVLLFLGIMYSLYRFQIRRERLKNELEFEQKEAERLKELDRIKTNFFSNITHEFRTPLTLILEPLRQLLKDDRNKDIEQKLHLAKNNSEKLLKLVNQLLDVSKLEAGKMTMDLRKMNVVQLVESIVESFKQAVHRQQIDLTFQCPEELADIFLDKQHVEKIITNLISNAIKFTKEGQVSIRLTKDNTGENILMIVSDTGIGIPKNQLAHVFERFYQVEGEGKESYLGTGIGLALTKELAELMGGRINVESQLGTGTSFTVILPATLTSNNIAPETNVHPVESAQIYQNDFSGTPINLSEDSGNKNDHQSLILLIEDNTELRHFIKQSISSQFQVIESENGEDGIEKALAEVPDLIISDVTMPIKDGFEVLETLKNNVITSHIPIVLLTAKTAIESKLEGLGRGADDYLTKPFNTEELLLRISNLINQRKKLQAKFANTLSEVIEQSTPEVLSVIDKKFLEDITHSVDAHLGNENFSVEELAKEVFMSRVHLFRKIKAITDQTPSEFIRNYRLDKAKEFLKDKENNVLQVSMIVGFANDKYFSRKFKERFGVSPSKIN